MTEAEALAKARDFFTRWRLDYTGVTGEPEGELAGMLMDAQRGAEARAEVERLKAQLSASYGVTEVWQREALASQTEREKAEARLAEVVKVKARVEAVLALHIEEWHQDLGAMCKACGDDWPCLTVRLLNGEEPRT